MAVVEVGESRKRVGVPLLKLDGLLTTKADGERHLP